MEIQKKEIEKISELQPELQKILRKMFKIAWYNPDEIILKTVNWQPYYLRYERTNEQEEQFRNWLIKELLNDNKLRKQFLRYNIRNKKIIEKAVDQFILNYWLKVKDINNVLINKKK